MAQLKEIKQEEFSMKIIKDLGMRKPTENYYKKVRMATFQCNNCKKPFNAVVTTKSKTQNYCKTCGNTDREKPNRDHKLYRIWADTKFKVTAGPESSHYTSYGSKGITVCTEWADNYDIFFEWAIIGYKEGLSIDRIDNDGNYEPTNCRWTTKAVQSANQRQLSRSNTTGYRGIHKTTTGRFTACARYENIVYSIGVYNTSLEAAKAYDSFIKLSCFPHTTNNLLIDGELVLPKNRRTLTFLQDKGIHIGNGMSKEP